MRLVFDTPEDREVANGGASGLERRLQSGGCVANLLHQPPCPFHRQSGKIKREDRRAIGRRTVRNPLVSLAYR